MKTQSASVSNRKLNTFIATSALLVATGAIWLSGSDPALADAEANVKRDGAVFQSRSKEAQAELVAGGAALKATANGKVLYTTEPPMERLSLGSAYISNNGETIAWLLSERFSGPYDDQAMKAPALICFKNGKIIKSYSLAELLVRKNMISRSASHTQWIPEKHDTGWRFAPTVLFAADGGRLEFETTSMRHYVCDPRTGNMTKSEDTEVWRDADVILYGEFTVEGRQINLKRPFFMKGTIANPEAAKVRDTTGSFTSGWHTLALKKEGDGWATTVPDYKVSTLYNMLPSASGENKKESGAATPQKGPAMKPLSFEQYKNSVKAVDMAKHTMPLEQFEKEFGKSGFYVIDLRSEHEYQGGHIKNALRLGADIDAEVLKKLVPDKKATVVIYCTNTLYPTRQISLTYPSLSQFLTLGYSNTYALQELWHDRIGRSAEFTKGPFWESTGSK
ncbi:MAG: rhodanese-like domain-containing protein [Cyanobacteria bacterium SZAS LIN-2]|nr:rhodanese-like domain-containing protein [Cyanobacteria bacterium SZAS LIN-2]